jgi:hypothetical protein
MIALLSELLRHTVGVSAFTYRLLTELWASRAALQHRGR